MLSINEMPKRNIITNDNPPPLGVGIECELRSLGISINSLFIVYCLINSVNTKEENTAIGIKIQLFKIISAKNNTAYISLNPNY